MLAVFNCLSYITEASLLYIAASLLITSITARSDL